MNELRLSDVDKIAEVVDLNDRVIKKMKFGLVQIMGEPQPREITWDTLQKLKKLPGDYTGNIEIKELKLVVPVHQIIKIEEKEEESTEFKNFTKLPTEVLTLDKDFHKISGTRRQIEREHDEYYLATCHYVEANGERQYYLEPHQIKQLIKMVRDEEFPEYPHYAKNPLRYGISVKEIHDRQAEASKKRKRR